MCPGSCLCCSIHSCICVAIPEHTSQGLCLVYRRDSLLFVRETAFPGSFNKLTLHLLDGLQLLYFPPSTITKMTAVSALHLGLRVRKNGLLRLLYSLHCEFKKASFYY